MAVNIDDLQVETQPPPAPSQGSPAPAAHPPELDFKREMEKFRERELRLQAD